MKIEADPENVETFKADSRGRINLGSDYGGEYIEVAVLRVKNEE